MKKEFIKILVSALILPILFFLIWGICYANIVSVEREQETLEEEGTGDVEYVARVADLESRGYVCYQDVCSGLLALKDNAAFTYMEYKEETDETKKTQADFSVLLGEESASQYGCLVVADERNENVATATLKFDTTKNTFQDVELIQQIETNGFPGFSKQIKKVEESIQKKCATRQGSSNQPYWKRGEECYYIDCEGVQFELSRKESGNFLVRVRANFSYCYAPEKYLTFIRQQMSTGSYYLKSSCVGGERDVVTFAKNNCITDYNAQVEEEVLDVQGHGKNISFVFDNGTLVDYFVTTCGADLQMDAEDEAFIAKATEGLDKELEKKPKTPGWGESTFRVYRTKA